MQNKIIRLIALISAIFLCVLGAGYWLLLRAFAPDETILFRSKDDINQLEAILVKREAGATVSTSFSVRIRAADSREKGTEALLIDKVNDPDAIALKWQGQTLQISLPSECKIFQQESSAIVNNKAVQILYFAGSKPGIN